MIITFPTRNEIAEKLRCLSAEVRNHIDIYEKSNSDLLSINEDLNRQVVSFQKNKSIPLHRLFKYKEGFSASLVDYLISTLGISESILDPFSGTGTTSIFAATKGIQSTGIELLPVGHCVAQAKSLLLRGLSDTQIQDIAGWISEKPWKNKAGNEALTTLRITHGAYTNETVENIESFLYLCKKEDEETATILMFALLSILESVSYTSKDGQCLRWDIRSGRTAGKRHFTKKEILSFNEAMEEKLHNIVQDLKLIHTPQDLFAYNNAIALPEFICGSVLQELPRIPSNSYKSIITSPPYCNRYDYTRTYALELAALGVNEAGIRSLRKTMLSCTVENQYKDLVSMNSEWQSIMNYTKNHTILRDILDYLIDVKEARILNNNGIPRMIEGYFVELACVIYECYRVLQAGGVFAMVNDNVQYAGVSIPVDLILSDIALRCGFFVDRIMVLPNGKGNSSQQMGRHGRNPLRKCVYVWRKEL